MKNAPIADQCLYEFGQQSVTKHVLLQHLDQSAFKAKSLTVSIVNVELSIPGLERGVLWNIS